MGDQMMMPIDLPDDALLVPIDVSADSFEDYDGHEEVVERVGIKGFSDAIVKGADLFEKTKINFKKDVMPIPMTVGEWKQSMPEDDDEDDDNGGGEEGEEEEEDDDDEEEEDAAPA